MIVLGYFQLFFINAYVVAQVVHMRTTTYVFLGTVVWR